ncbi:ABC transporter permease [Dysgonomonas capnocytophagoides]|uniref:ABC transporter permease n=1 Tax=Dysgonomonas capnocytophagoides TaxID=45254 RepID=UPI00333EF6B8
MVNWSVIQRRILRNKGLRLVNLMGISLIFGCMVLSYIYIKRETSFDRFNKDADRIARLSVQINDEAIDGRIIRDSYDEILRQSAEVEDIVKLVNVNAGVLIYNEKSVIINNFIFASPNFLKVFSYPLLEGERNTVLSEPGSVIISEKLAKQIGSVSDVIGKSIKIESRRTNSNKYTIKGIFKDFPFNSHLQTDLIIHKDEKNEIDWNYTYLLLRKNTEVNTLQNTLNEQLAKLNKDKKYKEQLIFTPLTDIHLHSRVLRELSTNGNIYYLYIIAGANLFLFIIIMFNLWLNSSLIISANKRYYQLLRLNGAPFSVIFKEETFIAFMLCTLSVIVGGMGIYLIAPHLGFDLNYLSISEYLICICVLFLFVVSVSIIPLLSYKISASGDHFASKRKSSASIRSLFTIQFGLVIFALVWGITINRQMSVIRQQQVTPDTDKIITLKEQPELVQSRYELLRSELLKHSEIEAVTASMQLPGSAVRDAISVKTDSLADDVNIPVLIVGEGFFPFFGIPLAEGTLYPPNKYNYIEQQKMLFDMFDGKEYDKTITENYIINKEAITALGFKSAEDAIGKSLTMQHGSINYIDHGTICGVIDHFNYTTSFETPSPLIIIQRAFFLNSIMIRTEEHETEKGLQVLQSVWKEIIPEYPLAYNYLDDLYKDVYRNELNGEVIIYIFTALCLLIANLSLITFVAFIIKQRKKEISIRKINGATAFDIIKMINLDFVKYIVFAFILVVPVSYYTLQMWLKNFAYQTSVNGWIFVAAGATVMIISISSITIQSLKAANSNPMKSLKSE